MSQSLTYGAKVRIGKVLCLAVSIAALPLLAGAQEIRLLALGDSLTQGYGLPQEDGFVPQLDAWLEDEGVEAEVVNGGVSGDTTAGGAARVAWSLSPEIDGMIVALGGNDLLRGIEPEESRRNLEKILAVARDGNVPVLLVGLAAPANYGPDYKDAFDAMFPELSKTYGTLYAPSFFEGLPGNDPTELRQFFQQDGIHPNARGVARIVEGLGPYVLGLIEKVK